TIRPGVENGAFDYQKLYNGSGLIQTNGDAELWEQICNYDNPGPVRALVKSLGSWEDDNVQLVVDPLRSFFGRDLYPAGAPVGDHLGKVVNGVQANNRFPWCVIRPTEPAELEAAETHMIGGSPLPFCPDELLVEDNRWKFPADYRAT